MTSAFVYDAIRTSFAGYGQALASVRPDDLAAHTVRALMARHEDPDPSRIDDVILGDANQAGEDNRSVARMAALLAGLPTSVPGSTVNRFCGSSMDAIMGASRMIETGDADVVLAGGVEPMSRSPWIMAKPDQPYPLGGATLSSSAVDWRMVNPAMPDKYVVSNGEGAEILADGFGISRERQDVFAARSHRFGAEAWDAGRYNELIPIPGVDLDRDEGIRPDSSERALAALRPAFRKNGTITAGNSSPLNDGASLTLIAGEGAPFEGEPLARIAGRGIVGNEPASFGIVPVEAANRALAQSGYSWADVDVVELNETFASQALACLAGWPELDPDKLNPDGSAIAIGHPRCLRRPAHRSSCSHPASSRWRNRCCRDLHRRRPGSRRGPRGMMIHDPTKGTPMFTWFITGCSTGLSRALAEAVIDAGQQVVVTAREIQRNVIAAQLVTRGRL